MELTWNLPWYLGPVLVVFALAAGLWTRRLYRGTEPRVSAGRRRLLTGLRVAALVLLLWALAGPALLRTLRGASTPVVAVVAEDSASMALRDAPGGPSRWETAARLSAVVDSLLARHAPDAEIVRLRGGGPDGTRPWRPDDPEAPPESRRTDLAGLMSALTRDWSDRALRAVVLLGDGQETPGAAAPVPAASAGATPVLVGVGDPQGPPDRRLRDLSYPDAAFRGDEITVEATVGLHGFGAEREAPVTLHLVQAGDTLASATAVPGPGDEQVRLELVFTTGAPGLVLYDLVVEGAVNERYLANNQASLAVAVRDERSRLLLLTGRPGWTVRMLANAARSEARLSLDVAYPGPGGWVLADSAGAWTPPDGAEGWRDWDGVVLAGPAGLKDRLDWSGLASAVRDGLGLLVLPPFADEGPDPALAALLPLSGLDGTFGGTWTPGVEPGVLGHPLLSGLPDGGGSPFAGLPPLTRLAGGSVAAEAEVLLSARASDGGPSRPLLLAGRAGEGAVTLFASDELWTLYFWQPPAGGRADAEHAGVRLARNLLAWTALGRSLAGVTLAGHRNLYREGEPIALETRGRDMRGRERARPVSLRVTRLDATDDTAAGEDAGDGEDVGTYSLDPVPGRPGHARTVLPPLPPARYAVQPVYAGTDSAAGPARPFLIVPAALEEMQTWQDRRRLRGLARRWHGVYVDGDDAGAAAELDAAFAQMDWSPVVRTTGARDSLWAGWPFLLVVLGLLGLEWGLRRREGML